jgi:hypothetical protein
MPSKNREEIKCREVSVAGSYFTVEGDENDLVKANTVGSEISGGTPLTWRGDPSETRSDWTIMIVTNALQAVTYHVHKCVLCFGSRHSKYFARLLMSQDSKKITKVELDERDAAHFPILLDYAYAPCTFAGSLGTIPTAMSTLTSPSVLLSQSKSSTEEEASFLALGDDINTKNAVSVRFLARRFEIDSLMLAVNRFIQKDLDLTTSLKYLTAAHEYDDARLLESATRLCVEHSTSLEKKKLTKLPPSVFRHFILSTQLNDIEDDPGRSLFLSEVVCRYFEKHPQFLTAGFLLEMTDPLFMPVVGPDAAMGFTVLIKRLTQDDAIDNWRDLAGFARRCARAVVRDYGWNDFSIDGAVNEYLQHCLETHGSASSQDSILFATSFAAALDQAQSDYEGIMSEQANLKHVVVAMDKTLNVMEMMSEKKDKYLAHQLKALDEAQTKIVKLEKELAEAQTQQQQAPAYYHQSPSKPQQQAPAHQQQSPSRSQHQAPAYQQQSSSRSQHQPSTYQHLSPSRPLHYLSDHPQNHATPKRPTKSLLDDDLSRSNATGTSDDDSLTSFMRDDPAIRDLVSPQSIGTEAHRNKIHKMKELRHKADKSYCAM